jgi:hypothetical protein
MTAEMILTLIGMGGSFTVVIGGAMLALVRWLVAAEKTKMEAMLSDHEARMRKVEAETGECVRRSDLDGLRRELDQRFDRLAELLNEPRGAPRRRRA